MCPQFLEAVRVPKLRATAPDPTYRLRDNPPFAVYTETLESLNKFYKRTVVRNLDKLCVSPSRPRDYVFASRPQSSTRIKIFSWAFAISSLPQPNSPIVNLRLPHSPSPNTSWSFWDPWHISHLLSQYIRYSASVWRKWPFPDRASRRWDQHGTESQPSKAWDHSALSFPGGTSWHPGA